MSLYFSQRAERVPCRKSRVRGGAFLGLIVGIIIGLAVALGVAIYIAKVPIPFVNNVPVSNGGQNAAEDQKNQNWNPNATLQTHGPALPASDVQQSVAVPPPVEVVPPAPALPGQSAGNVQVQPHTALRPAAGDMNWPNPEQGGPSSYAQPAANDPLGDFAAARAKGSDGGASGNANANAATAGPFIYFVQTGAFHAPQDADAERARLSLLGMEAAITERDQAGRVVYRVRVGPFQNKAAADQVQARLTDNGFEAALVRAAR